jgi:hypothetical protein
LIPEPPTSIPNTVVMDAFFPVAGPPADRPPYVRGMPIADSPEWHALVEHHEMVRGLTFATCSRPTPTAGRA